VSHSHLEQNLEKVLGQAVACPELLKETARIRHVVTRLALFLQRGLGDVRGTYTLHPSEHSSRQPSNQYSWKPVKSFEKPGGK
jgi:hypothetical protein